MLNRILRELGAKSDSFFDDFYNDFRNFGKEFVLRFPTTFVEEEDRYVYIMSVPGLSKEDITVSIKEDILSILLNKPPDKSISNAVKSHLKFYNLPFTKSHVLDSSLIDVESITSKLETGLLFIELKKKREEKKSAGGKKIPIN